MPIERAKSLLRTGLAAYENPKTYNDAYDLYVIMDQVAIELVEAEEQPTATEIDMEAVQRAVKVSQGTSARAYQQARRSPASQSEILDFATATFDAAAGDWTHGKPAAPDLKRYAAKACSATAAAYPGTAIGFEQDAEGNIDFYVMWSEG